MTQSPQEKLAALAQRAIPFLRDEGAKYEDDGSNEPLELARDIEQALSEHGEVVVTTDESGRCVAVTRQDSEGRILSTIWEASEHGGGGEAAPFAYVLVEGNPGSCAELMFPRDARKGERGAKAAWRELGEGLHPLYLHPPVATEPVAKLVNRIDSDGGKTTTFIRPTALGMDLPLGEYPLYTTPPTPSAPIIPPRPPVPDDVDEALSVVNDAANEARHAGNYAKANALVRARVVLYRAAAATPSAPVPFDVETMLRECVPGGSSCDPQAIADAIREYIAALPSAPVVDDAIKAAAMRCARRAYGFWRGGSNGSGEALQYFDGGYVGRERDAAMYEAEIRAALSGASAPVGVEAVLRRIVAEADTHPFNPIGHVIEHVVPEARTVIAQEKV